MFTTILPQLIDVNRNTKPPLLDNASAWVCPELHAPRGSGWCIRASGTVDGGWWVEERGVDTEVN